MLPKIKLRIDPWLLLCTALLCGVGLLILHSATGQDPDALLRQGARVLVGLGVMFAVAQIPPVQIERFAPWLYAAGVVLLLLVLAIGDIGRGARRWLDIGVMRFQPSEMMKLAVPLCVAAFLASRHNPPRLPDVLISLAMVLIPVGLVAKQPDLGTSLLIAASGAFVVYFAEVAWKYIAVAAGTAIAGLPLLWFVMHDYQRQRVLTMLDPERDPLGTGYHIIQSKIAVGSGGLYGKGWLNGTQSRLEFIPERTTDFIFAVLCEEFGFAGVLALFALYAVIIARGFYIAANAQDIFGRLVAGSLTLTFFIYLFVNTSMVIGQLPVVGVPLPLVSYGGTSMVTLFAGFGILVSIHTHRRMLSGA
ncbi:MAG: rod shape-determining protein RodA [Gammaproteobacteria bacterium]